MIITTNIPALNIHNAITRTNRKANSSMERLSTGFRINSAADDPSGLASVNRMRRQVSGLASTSQNALDATSIIQLADSALNEMHSILHRMRELTVQVANGTMTVEDSYHVQAEIDQLNAEINSIGRNTVFNNKPLFNGTFEDGNIDGHIHGRKMARTGTMKDQTMYMTFPEISTQVLGTEDFPISEINITRPARPTAGVDGTISLEDEGIYNTAVANHTLALENAFAALDEAIHQISSGRANLGAYENRLEHTASVISSTSINMQSALSRMVDVDMALEMSVLTQQNLISQAGLAVLSQANQRPQQILQFIN